MSEKMRRFLVVMCMTMGIFVLFACGGNENGSQSMETPEATKAGMDDKLVNASGSAVSKPPLSDAEAFTQAEELVKGMTLEEKVGQMFLVELSQLDSPKKNSGRRYRLTKNMVEMMHNYPVGGVILTGRNVKNPEQMGKLTADLQASASGGAIYIAAEEEGCVGHSLSADVDGMEDMNYMSVLRQSPDLTDEQVRHEGVRVAERLRLWGFNLNLAPVADLASETNPGYAPRCLNADTGRASDLLESLVVGMRDGGLAVTLKYFPGMGSVVGNYEEEILDNQESLMSLRDNSFSVYTAGIDAGADCVMVADTAVSRITVNDKLPAFLSQEIVTSLLREEIGFQGIIMTPPLMMKAITKNYTPEYAVVEAVRAGCDMIVMPEDLKRGYRALLDAVVSGRIDEKVINTSVRRILQDKLQRQILVLDETVE